MPRASESPHPSDRATRRSSLLSEVSGVDHGFTGRRDARVEGELHLAPRPAYPEVTEAVLAQNWAAAIRPHRVEQLTVVSQVHGRVVHVDRAATGPTHPAGEGDALVSTRPGVVVAVRVADCVPVLLAALHDGRAVGVAAVHSGWRGTAVGIVGAAVEELSVATSVRASGMVAAIGPSICGHHYEVGDEVVTALESTGVPASAFVVGTSPRGRPLVDVASAVAYQLTMAGVAAVDRLPGCTYEDPDLWSHRRDGDMGGRQAAWITRASC